MTMTWEKLQISTNKYLEGTSNPQWAHLKQNIMKQTTVIKHWGVYTQLFCKIIFCFKKGDYKNVLSGLIDKMNICPIYNDNG